MVLGQVRGMPASEPITELRRDAGPTLWLVEPAGAEAGGRQG